MNVIDHIRNKYAAWRLERLRKQLMQIKKQDEFKPFDRYTPASLIDEADRKRQLVENLVWFSARPEVLRDFYRSDSRGSTENYYWKKCPSNERIVHSGIPSLISEKMSTIIFGPGFSPSFSLGDKTSDSLTEIANEIFDRLDLPTKLNLAAQTESWCGHVSFKLSYDLSLSSLPILEIVDRRDFELLKERGILLGIKYHVYYDVGPVANRQHFRLSELYSTDQNGDATIESRLYRLESGDVKEVSLTTIPETADLLPFVTFEGLKGILALEKPNLPSNEEYGRSDFARAHSCYDALDEIISGIVNELRQNRTQRFIPQSMVPVNDSGEYQSLSDFVTTFIKTAADPDQNADNVPTYQAIPDKTLDHLEKYKVLIGQACNLSGLSPLSLGITGLESINSSDRSTRERAKTTLETRKAKLELWRPFLAKFLEKYLILTQYLQKKSNLVEEKTDLRGFDLSSLKVSVTFNDYIESGIEDRIAVWSTAKQSGLASTEMAVDRIYSNEITDQEKAEEVRRIHQEQNLLIDPDDQILKLNLPEL